MQVIKAVIIQQVVQTVLGLCWLENEETILIREVHIDHLIEMRKLAGPVGKVLRVVLGEKTMESLVMVAGKELVQWVYWWGIPMAQLGFAL